MNPEVSAVRILLLTMFVIATQAANAVVSDSGTMTVGATLELCHGLPYFETQGYETSPALGTYSPLGLTGGETVVVLMNNVVFPTPLGCPALGSSYAYFFATGFSSNPGSSWLISITCDGVTLPGSSATFDYGAGAAWIWNGSLFTLPGNGMQTSCIIQHN
jgi:hypothetical protein